MGGQESTGWFQLVAGAYPSEACDYKTLTERSILRFVGARLWIMGAIRCHCPPLSGTRGFRANRTRGERSNRGWDHFNMVFRGAEMALAWCFATKHFPLQDKSNTSTAQLK